MVSLVRFRSLHGLKCLNRELAWKHACRVGHVYLCIGVSLSLHGVGWSLHEGHLFCLA